MQLLKKIIKKVKSVLLWEVTNAQTELQNEVVELRRLALSNVEISQRLLALKYHELAKTNPKALPPLSETGFRVHSQFDEDGILLYIFSVIGATTKKCIEIGTTDGKECNTTNLIIYHGWSGLLIDGNEPMIKIGQEFFAKHPNTVLNEPKMVFSWVKKDNVNQLLSDNGFAGEVDLLSIDIDGVDYHILEAMTNVSPRVVICEINSVVPLGKALTIPYEEDFFCWNKGYPAQMFMGMSMTAAAKLMKKKGYRLVGAHRIGFNVIFMRNDVGMDVFPEISLEEARGPKFNHTERAAAWELVKGYPWVEV